MSAVAVGCFVMAGVFALRSAYLFGRAAGREQATRSGRSHHATCPANSGLPSMQHDGPCEAPPSGRCPECGGAIAFPHYHRDTLDGPEVVRHVDHPGHGFEDERSSWTPPPGRAD